MASDDLTEVKVQLALLLERTKDLPEISRRLRQLEDDRLKIYSVWGVLSVGGGLLAKYVLPTLLVASYVSQGLPTSDPVSVEYQQDTVL